jgi:hypothetical protein
MQTDTVDKLRDVPRYLWTSYSYGLVTFNPKTGLKKKLNANKARLLDIRKMVGA